MMSINEKLAQIKILICLDRDICIIILKLKYNNIYFLNEILFADFVFRNVHNWNFKALIDYFSSIIYIDYLTILQNISK